MEQKFVLVIHGGAGTILKKHMTPEKETAYTNALNEALQKGYKILKEGGTAVDAAEATVKILEDCPLFNAGKGSVFTNEGKNEMDASIMDGKNLKAGALAGVTALRYPVSAARAIMEKSDHVMLIGVGAEEFAKTQGLEFVTQDYFYTEERWKALMNLKEQDSHGMQLDHDNTLDDAFVKHPEKRS